MPILMPSPYSVAVGKPSASLSPAVPIFIAVALAISMTVLIGWSTNNLAIASFGNGVIMMQPWTAVACIGLGTSFLFAATGHANAARILAVTPLTIAFITLAQDWLGTRPAFDQTFFSQTILHQSRISPGRPGLMTAITILLLGLACLTTVARSAAIRRLTTLLSCLAFSLVLLSGALLPLGISVLNAETRWALVSMPTACTLGAISFAVVAHRRYTAWPTSAHCSLHGLTLQWILVLCILLPIVSAFWQLWMYKAGGLSHEMGQIIQAAFQIIVSCLIISWTWVRIGQERSERWTFSTAIDSAPIALTDMNGRIIRWSKGCERLYGWSLQEARGKDKHALTGALFPPGLKVEFTSDDPQEIEITEHHRDGTRLKILEMRRLVQPRPDLDPMIVISMTDITERHRAKQAMLASEARLTFAADLHELGLFEWAEATDKVRLSPHAERLLGFNPGEFTGGLAEWRSLIRQTFSQDILSNAPLSELSAARHAFRLSSTHAGQTSVVEGSIFFYDPPGVQGLSMLGIIMDVSERERRTEMLKAREFELRSILETVPEAMITVDEAGRVRSFSRTAEELFGYAAEDITGREIRSLLPEYAKAAVEMRNLATNAATMGKAPPPWATKGYDRQGNEIPVELFVGETTIGIENISIAFVRSLREQIATQTRLNELREQLLHASRVSAMGEMGAGLAHELNQPLTATANLLGAAYMRLSMDTDRDKVQQLVELANMEVLRAGEIIRRMRNFVARGELDIRSVPLNELIVDALQLAWSRSRHAGVNLDYQPSPCHSEVLVDQIQIQQVLVNIISNALETFTTHETEKPEIIITTNEQPGGTVLIRLQDNGPGFASSIIDRPFEAFVSTRANGLGLGLSICRRIVEGHGGTLTLANGPHGGAVIEFTLPVYAGQSYRGLAAVG